MTVDASIQTLLTIGENVAIEFKRAGNGPEHDTYETICAFLNRRGGDVLLGVADDGEVLGIPPKAAKDMAKQLANVMNDPNLWEPCYSVYPEIVDYKGKTIIRIHVPVGPDVYRFKGKCYDRVNEADVVVRGTAPIADMFLRKREIYTERRVFPFVRKSDLRLDLLPGIRNMALSAHGPMHPWIHASDSDILRSAKLLARDPVSGKDCFNGAAVLLLGDDYILGDCYPAYKTDALLRRVNVDRYDDRDTVRSNLVLAFDRLIEFGEKHLDDKFFIEGTTRVSIRAKILREMVGNTLAHREFSSALTARFIIERTQMFTENANKAINPGVITLENLKPYPKNPIIANFFHQIGRADELGSGVRNLYHYVKIYSGAEPIFDEEDIFRLTVPLNDDYSPEKGLAKVAVDPEKVAVDPEKVAVGSEKVAIDGAGFQRYLATLALTKPTYQNIMAIFNDVGYGVFGRSQVMASTNMGSSGAGKLLNLMLQKGLMLSVSGYGKGRYRFRQTMRERKS